MFHLPISEQGLEVPISVPVRIRFYFMQHQAHGSHLRKKQLGITWTSPIFNHVFPLVAPSLPVERGTWHRGRLDKQMVISFIITSGKMTISPMETGSMSTLFFSHLSTLFSLISQTTYYFTSSHYKRLMGEASTDSHFHSQNDSLHCCNSVQCKVSCNSNTCTN